MKKFSIAILAGLLGTAAQTQGQVVDQPLAFSDLLLPIEGEKTPQDTWGGDNVKSRYVDNGIEDSISSIWGGYAFKGEDGLYHMFLCSWDEAVGHDGFKTKSEISHAVSTKASGPYVRKEVLGYGFDPEVIRTPDGGYIVKVWEGQYVSKSINGPWTYEKMSFDTRGRLYYKGSSLNSLSNMTYAERPDHSYVAVDRGGAVWVSRDGKLSWTMITDLPVFFHDARIVSDPVIWHDDVQYYMMDKNQRDQLVNFYRSIDGLHWKREEAFKVRMGIVRHADGTKEEWRDLDRFKVMTDEKGRVENLVVSVCDIDFAADKPNDNHSSKIVVVPFVKPRLLEVASAAAITTETSTVDILVRGEADFNPAKELDVKSLRLGSHQATAQGKGLRAVKIKKHGKGNVIVTFAGDKGELDIDANEWALRMVGKTKKGQIVHGYASRPGFSMDKSHILAAMMPQVDANDVPNAIEVENFGVASSPTITVKILTPDDAILATGTVDPLEPYAKRVVSLNGEKNIPTGTKSLKVIFYEGDQIANQTTIATRNINSFQERLVALVDSARSLSENDNYTEGKMELQMAMMDGLSNISRFDLAELQESYGNLEEGIGEFFKANNIDIEFYDFYSWARIDGAKINVSEQTIDVMVDGEAIPINPIENFSDNKATRQVNGRIAIFKSDRHFDLRNNGENNKFTGLFDYSRTAYLSIRDLTPGTRISFKGNDLAVLNGEHLYLADDPEQTPLAPKTKLASKKSYVVKGEPGQKVNIDFKGEHYTCVQSITIENPVPQPAPAEPVKKKRNAR